MCFLPPCFISWKWYHANQNHRAFRVQSVIERAPLKNWHLPTIPTTNRPALLAPTYAHSRWLSWFVFIVDFYLFIFLLMGTGCGRWKVVGNMAHEHRHTWRSTLIYIFVKKSSRLPRRRIPDDGDAVEILVTCGQKGARCRTRTHSDTHLHCSDTVSQRGSVRTWVWVQQTAGRVTDTQPASQMACSTLPLFWHVPLRRRDTSKGRGERSWSQIRYS